jgi:hypothetical protein
LIPKSGIVVLAQEIDVAGDTVFDRIAMKSILCSRTEHPQAHRGSESTGLSNPFDCQGEPLAIPVTPDEESDDLVGPNVPIVPSQDAFLCIWAEPLNVDSVWCRNHSNTRIVEIKLVFDLSRYGAENLCPTRSIAPPLSGNSK